MTDVRFVASIHPDLAAGLYSVRVGQRLHSGALDVGFGALAGAPDLRFDAGGPRTQLPTGAVVARFPVPGSSGHQAGTLAHVVLADPTLPWLRSPWSAGTNPDPTAAWLALILIGGDELATVGRRSVNAGALGRPLDPGEPADSVVNLLSLPADVAARVLPTAADLPFLSHVRETDGADASVHAVVVCNRLPVAGAHNEVHLVSLEGVAPPAPSGPPVELVSLEHWQFDSTENGPDFRELAIALAHNCRPLRQETGVPAADDQLRRGVVAMPYHGAPAWYRGPLVPAPDDPARRALVNAVERKLPGRAEDLLLYDETLGMVDATYAVAWDLGRALTLADGHAARTLDAFWRARRRHAHSDGELQGLVAHRQPEPTPPADLIAWFEALLNLRAVPIRYLLPDPDRLVPSTLARWQAGGVERSARGRLAFFTVDPIWATVLALGAATVGLVTARERDELARMNLKGSEYLRGFVLRSELVRWDDLRIRVWLADGTLIPAVERDLGADLRLVIFESGAPSLTVELSRAPHGLHFGIEEVTSPLQKFPRDASGVTAQASVDVPERPGAAGTLAVAGLAANLGVTDAAAFARHMVLGSPSVQFVLDMPGAP